MVGVQVQRRFVCNCGGLSRLIPSHYALGLLAQCWADSGTESAMHKTEQTTKLSPQCILLDRSFAIIPHVLIPRAPRSYPLLCALICLLGYYCANTMPAL